MSKKKEMTKRQRLYYEYQNKEKVRQELAEIAKQIKEIEDKTMSVTSFNPHQNSYYQ
jgi:hypothetical protein